jgi:hypothetical protein
MMGRIIAVGWVILLVMLNPVGAGAATDIGVEDLLADSAGFDQQTVSVVGELIGDYGFRRDGSAWSQLNGDSYATAPLREGGSLNGSNIGIGVRAPAALLRNLDPPGDYQHRGPLVRATGTWRYHDADRGGETYLDVANLEILERGTELAETAPPVVIGTGVLLLLLALGLGYRARRRSIG